MQKLLSTSTAARPTGSPPQRRLFRVASGVYAGRLAALFSDSPGNISLKYADQPYLSWSAPQVIASDAHDSPFSACVDSSGNIYLAYTDTSEILKSIKLTFAGGVWAAGTPQTVINVDKAYNPVILMDGDGKLWCFFDHHRLSLDMRHYARVKSSADDGLTWGSGPTDLGTQLSAAWIDLLWIGACRSFSKLYAVYCADRSRLLYRVCELSSATWGDEATIAELNYIDDDFDLAPSSDGRLGVVFIPSESGRVYLKEFDGLTWSGLIEVEVTSARSPQIFYQDTVPHIFYARHLGGAYYIPRAAVKSGASFMPSDLAPYSGTFEKVLLFNSGAAQYQDKTAAAANVTSEDILHTASNGLLDSVGDCLYLGKTVKFNLVAIILYPAGTGGAVAWEYFDGVAWIEFTPHSGAFNFDNDDKLVYLWQDGASTPSDWQLGTVDGTSAFWVRARVAIGFSVNPIGTQILAACKLDDFSLVR